jgi:hypothetical protein
MVHVPGDAVHGCAVASSCCRRIVPVSHAECTGCDRHPPVWPSEPQRLTGHCALLDQLANLVPLACGRDARGERGCPISDCLTSPALRQRTTAPPASAARYGDADGPSGGRSRNFWSRAPYMSEM